jgi:hypothetical protein
MVTYLRVTTNSSAEEGSNRGLQAVVMEAISQLIDVVSQGERQPMTKQ